MRYRKIGYSKVVIAEAISARREAESIIIISSNIAEFK